MPGNALTPEQVAHRLKVFDQASTDTEAARMLGIHQSTFTHWRKAMGIPPKNRWTGHGDGADREGYMTAYEECGSDGEAGRRLGIKPSTFQSWRQRQGLPAKMKSFADLLTDEDRKARLEAYYQSTSLADFAKRTGLTVAGAGSWLKNQSLLAPSVMHRVLAAEKRFRGDRSLYLYAYESTETDLEGARLMGVTVSEFRQWRIGEGLPPATAS